MTVNPIPASSRASSALARRCAFIWFIPTPYDGCVTESRAASIRPLNVSDIDVAVVLNNAEVPNVGPTDAQHFGELLNHSGVVWGIDAGDSLAALLVAFEPGAVYESTNYCWFNDRFDDFIYVDRVVVAFELRGQGIGRAFYERLAAHYLGAANQMTCEVNLDPPNEASMAFHLRMGFEQIGSKLDDSKVVALLSKPLGGSRS